MSDTSTATSRLIGEIFVERGLVTAEQLENALAMQLSTGDRLGEILVGHFGVPRLELASVLAEQWADVDRSQGIEVVEAASPSAPLTPSLEQVEREVEEIDRRPIGEIFVEGGFVTEEELERALVTQRETGQRLGEVLVAQGSITRLALAGALAEQWAGLPKLRPPAPPVEADGNGAPLPAEAPTEAEPSSQAVEVVQPPPTADDRLREELERQREALKDVRERVERPDDRIDALAGRLDELAARAVSSDQLDALRRELGELAARPAGDAGLAARLDDVAVKLHAIGDMEALRAALAERVEELAVRVHEVGALDGDLKALRASLDELRSRAGVDEGARARLDQLAARLDEHGVASVSSPDPELAARLDELDRKVSHAAGSDDVRKAFAAVHEEMREVAAQIDEAPDLEAIARRLDAIDARLSDSSEQHKIRTAISDLQAELAALGGRDERGRLDSLVERLDVIEGGLPSPAVLDTLRGDVAGLLARPAADPALDRRVDELAARLNDHDAVTSELAGLRATVETLAVRSAVDEEARARLDGLAQYVQGLADTTVAPDDALAPRLDEVERRLDLAAPSDDVRNAFVAVREEMRDVAAQIEGLAALFEASDELVAIRASLAELEARSVADPALATRFDELERGLALAAGTDDVRDAFAAVREEMREVAAQIEELPVLDGIAERLDALELRASDRAETQSLRSSLGALHAELQALAGRDDRGRLDAIHARIDQVEQAVGEASALDASLRADVESLLARAGEPAEQDLGLVRAHVDELEARFASAKALEELRAELEARAAGPATDPAAAARLDQLAMRLDELAGDAARNDDVVALRETVAQLELRPPADPTLPERLGELVRRAETWQASAEGVQELRVLVAELEARPTFDASLAGRLEVLAGRLDELAATAAPHDELKALRHAISRLEQKPDADPDLPARLGALSSRVDLLEPTSTRVDELSLRVEELSARPSGDPALAGRLEALERRLDESRGLATAVERIEDELELLRSRTDEGAASAARGASALEATLRAQLDEAIAESRAQAETSGLEVSARFDDVTARLDALSGFGRRTDELEAGNDVLRKELKALAKTVDSREATLADSVDRVEAEARAESQRLGAAIEDLMSAAAERDEQFRAVGEELRARVEVLAAQAPIDAAARDEIADLRETLLSLGASLDELAVEHAHETEQAEVAAAGVAARIDDLALRVSESRTEADEALRAELGELAARVEENDAAGVVARDEGRAELERVAASIGWRLERVEEALSADDRDADRQALAEVAQRLDAQEGRQEEQVRVTERALRKGLASLGDRLADSEAEYVKAGNALRRSIERLGSAIVEADVATVERSSEATLALHHANATSYVAFAPTADGYRLVAAEGRVPEVGAHVELPQCAGALVVTRVGASPIPLDTRPCAYLERA